MVKKIFNQLNINTLSHKNPLIHQVFLFDIQSLQFCAGINVQLTSNQKVLFNSCLFLPFLSDTYKCNI